MANVLITSEYFGRYADTARALLLAAGHTVVDNPYGHKFLTAEEIIPHIGDAQAIICDLERITRQVIDAAPNLRIIARRGVGIDSVDFAYAHTKGIQVARTLGVVEAPVAELVMGYILSFSRHIDGMSRLMHEGKWQRIPSSSVAGKTLGIVGMGKIAQAVAARAVAFGMRIVYTDVSAVPEAEAAFGAERMPLEALLAQADYVTLHMPLTPETEGMIGAAALSLMKPTACLINTARGAIVQENALADALRNGTIAGAAIDVYDKEPNTDSPLRGLDNAILTPHIGTFTRETYINMDVAAAENIIQFFKGV